MPKTAKNRLHFAANGKQIKIKASQVQILT
jgi:hypothetical protein